MPTPARTGLAVFFAALLGCAPLVGAQEKPQTQAQPQPEPKKMNLDELPPQMKLGIRAELVRRQMPVGQTVVIVRDARSYLAALGRWSTEIRFPVLIDDGTWEARENIARLVRGFSPKSVVRWSAPADALWPFEVADQQRLVESVVAHAWGARDWAAYPERLKTINAMSIGIVAASMSDPAWPAAAALAAGHGQSLAWVTSPSNVSGQMSLKQADELSAQITKAASESGFPWEAAGDAIDSVTLCLNVPSKVLWQSDGESRGRGPISPVVGEPVATTDLIGRHPRGDRTDRWAWCGQIFGNEAQSAYRAMCALFIMPRRAWVFDGYDATPPFTFFDGTETASLLKKYGFAVDLDDTPNQSLFDWRKRTAGSWLRRSGSESDRKATGCLDAGLICVNTSGMSESFDLKPGQAVAGDVPFMDVPAMVHFVHSWSAQYPAARATIAGRWLERGAYAYAGSVHEPYLEAFQPTPIFIKRLMAPTAFGAAARRDGSPPWRIAVFGDPLITIGPPAQVSDKEVPLAAMIELRDSLADELRARKFDEAFATLLLSGRDADLVRLAKATIKAEPDKVSPEAAMLALGAALRRADLDGFVSLYRPLAEQLAPSPVAADMGWHALHAAASMLTLDQAQLLGKTLRPGSFARDADEVARMIRRLGGEKARRDWLDSLMASSTDANQKRAIDAIISPPSK